MTPLADIDRSTKENKVQQLDKESGVPVWTVDVMDFDPEARERTLLRMKIARFSVVLVCVAAGRSALSLDFRTKVR